MKHFRMSHRHITPMWSNSVSLDIQAPPAALYTYLADFSRHAEWSNVLAIKLVSGENGHVGARYEASENIPAPLTTFPRITELEPPRRIAWEATDNQVFRTHWSFEIEPLGDSSRLTQNVTFHPLTDEAVDILNVYRVPYVEKENLNSLGRIKNKMETG